MTAARAPASASSSSRTSPAVIDRTAAALGRDDQRGAVHGLSSGRGGHAGIVRRTAPAAAANPSASRVRARPRTRAPFPRASADTSQPSEGRTRSAQIATVSAADNSACRHSRSGRGRAATPPAAAASQRRRASAPLASQRSCQVAPGCSSSQSSSRASPRTRRCLGARRPPATNGGRVSCSQAVSRGCRWRASRQARAARGNRARAASPRCRSAARIVRPLAMHGGHDAPFPNSTSSVSGR